MDTESECSSVKNTNFCDRRKNLINQLSELEKSMNKHKNHESSYVPKLEDLTIHSRNKNKLKGFRGRQSIFKRPDAPAPRTNLRTIPDYHLNPKKWTCYSLDDVKDMSNESNSQAAFSFLKELKNQKKQNTKQNLKLCAESMEVDEVQNTSKKSEDISKSGISFSKPIRKELSIQLNSKPEFRNNKIIMPEYEVGIRKESKKKNNQRKNIKIDKNKEMKLEHLQMFDDE